MPYLQRVVDQAVYAPRFSAGVGIDKMLRVDRVAVRIVAMTPLLRWASTNTIPSARSEGRKSASEKEHSVNLLGPWQCLGPCVASA